MGFAKTAPTIERIEHLWPEPKKVFGGVSFEASVEKGQPIEHLERSGEFKGVRERRQVFDGRGGGFGQNQGSKVNKLHVGAVW